MPRSFATLLAIAALPAVAAAQAGPSFGNNPGPAVSPYLNLLRTNSPAYLNYYGLVQPQLQAQANQQQLQGQLNGLDQSFTTFATNTNNTFNGLGNGLVTGNGFGFQTHRGYFQTQLRGGGRGVSGGGGVPGFGGGGGAGFGTQGVGQGGAGLGGLRR